MKRAYEFKNKTATFKIILIFFKQAETKFYNGLLFYGEGGKF